MGEHLVSFCDGFHFNLNALACTCCMAHETIATQRKWLAMTLRCDDDDVSSARWLTVEVNQSLDNVALPSSLQSLTFGNDFDQNLDNVALPSGLQSLTFGACNNQSLDNVALPSCLQSLTFGYHFDQSLDNVALPSGLQSLNFGARNNQSLDNVALPWGLQS